jgi:hypothetical protein
MVTIALCTATRCFGGQARYMLEGIVDVVGDRLGRALPLLVRALRAPLAIQDGSGAVEGRRRLVQERHCVCAGRGSGMAYRLARPFYHKARPASSFGPWLCYASPKTRAGPK